MQGDVRGRQGLIPFRLRIGVTGHRDIEDSPELTAAVARALDRIEELTPASPATPIRFTAVSALAEGADRLLAVQILQTQDARLEAVLPLRPEEYVRDFESEVSRRAFEELLGRASEVTELPEPRSRSGGYAQLGRYIVDRSDVLIALWDGQAPRGEGGTAEVVSHARERGIPLLWIDPARPGVVAEEVPTGVGGASLLDLDRYNRSEIMARRFDREVRRQSEKREQSAERSGLAGQGLREASAWLWPYYARADLLAERHQAGYQVLEAGLFVMAAGAVAAGAAEVLLVPHGTWLVWIEVALLVGLLAVVGIGRRARLHDRWVSYRFLAERFRSAFFLALTGMGEWREGGLDRAHLGREPEEWLRRAFAEVWARRPRIEPEATDLAALRRFLADEWIGDQARYHRAANRRNAERQRTVTGAIALIFALTLVAALAHATLGVEREAPGEPSLGIVAYLAIVLPAFGGALGGIRAQREYARQAERFGRMVPHLENAQRHMEAARDLNSVRAVAAEAEDLMLEENRDWFVVVRFHDFELHL